MNCQRRFSFERRSTLIAKEFPVKTIRVTTVILIFASVRIVQLDFLVYGVFNWTWVILYGSSNWTFLSLYGLLGTPKLVLYDLLNKTDFPSCTDCTEILIEKSEYI